MYWIHSFWPKREGIQWERKGSIALGEFASIKNDVGIYIVSSIPFGQYFF